MTVQYIWSRHAEVERLPERSGLSKAQVEQKLVQRKYIVSRHSQEHHLIWDEVRNQLIDIPVIIPRIIPTVLPISYGSGYAEWQRAEAERAWRGEDFYQEQPLSTRLLCTAEIFLAKTVVDNSGRRCMEEEPILSWLITDKGAAEYGDEGVLALFRNRTFCKTVQRILLERSHELLALSMSHANPFIHLKKPGAHRQIPIHFFLNTP